MREGFLLAYSCTAQPIHHWGESKEQLKQVRNLEAGSWKQAPERKLWLGGELLTGLLLPACSLCFLLYPRTTYPGSSITHSELGPPLATIKQDSTPGVDFYPSGGCSPSQHDSSSVLLAACVKREEVAGSQYSLSNLPEPQKMNHHKYIILQQFQQNLLL